MDATPQGADAPQPVSDPESRVRSAPLAESDIVGLKYFDQLLPLLDRLKDDACLRDKAGNRELHFDQYCLLVLLYLFNPTCSSLRAIQQASELKNVQQRPGCARASLGSLSEAGTVFDPERLVEIIQELGGQVQPLTKDENQRVLTPLISLQPSSDDELSNFFRWLTHTHVMRWHAHYHTEGTGHLYQGRFKAFPIEEDDHLYAVLRYVERNPVRANLCERAEDWKFGSAWRMAQGDETSKSILSDWPLPRPLHWREHVNQPQSEAEVDAIRRSVKRGTPYGSESWTTQSAARLQLNHTLRSRGRPSLKTPELHQDDKDIKK